jgi:hypothetical protein
MVRSPQEILCSTATPNWLRFVSFRFANRSLARTHPNWLRFVVFPPTASLHPRCVILPTPILFRHASPWRATGPQPVPNPQLAAIDIWSPCFSTCDTPLPADFTQDASYYRTPSIQHASPWWAAGSQPVRNQSLAGIEISAPFLSTCAPTNHAPFAQDASYSPARSSQARRSPLIYSMNTDGMRQRSL